MRSMSSPNPPRARGTRRADVSTGLAGVRRMIAPARSSARTSATSSLTGAAGNPPHAR